MRYALRLSILSSVALLATAGHLRGVQEEKEAHRALQNPLGQPPRPGSQWGPPSAGGWNPYKKAAVDSPANSTGEAMPQGKDDTPVHMLQQDQPRGEAADPTTSTAPATTHESLMGVPPIPPLGQHLPPVGGPWFGGGYKKDEDHNGRRYIRKT